jgi:outer membrane protein OmpA-like peptidoglycan-associated protein
MRLRPLLAFALFCVCWAPAVWAPPAARADAPQAEAASEDAGDCVGKARLRGLVFANGGSKLSSVDQVMLDPVADAIKTRCVGKTITIEGHTSISGSPAYNQKLSERRAEAVKRYLVSRGVPAEQLRVVGYGESRPLTKDPSPEAQKVNRRVTLVAS